MIDDIMRVANQVKQDIDDHLYQEIEEQAKWHLGDYIPNSWLDDSGIRHAVVWNEGEEIRYKLIDGRVLLEDRIVF